MKISRHDSTDKLQMLFYDLKFVHKRVSLWLPNTNLSPPLLTFSTFSPFLNYCAQHLKHHSFKLTSTAREYYA
jgi:hypothetical protein